MPNRDEILRSEIESLLSMLPKETGWTESDQGRFFASTMFPNIDITTRLPRVACGRWEQYLTVRETLLTMEEFFAVQYFSKELLQVFHNETQSGNYRTSHHKYLCNLLRGVEVRCQKTTDPCSAMHLAYAESASPQQNSNTFGSAFGLIADYEHGTLIDIVNTIRNNQDDFAEIEEQ